MSFGETETGVVIIGAGPAGLGPLFAAASEGLLRSVLASGVTILERSDRVGSGALGSYYIRSDSGARTFADIVMKSREPRLLELRNHPITKQLVALGNQAVDLSVVAKFLELAGTVLCALIAEHPRCRVLTGVTALSIERVSPSLWRTRYRNNGGSIERSITSSSVLLATGGAQSRERLVRETVAGASLGESFAHKLMQSGEVFSPNGLSRVVDHLQGRATPKVAIIGGSTSAAAIAVTLLERLPDVTFGSDAISILHRKPLRIFYESQAEALADGYADFGPSDVCSLTGRVYRLGGFRLDS